MPKRIMDEFSNVPNKDSRYRLRKYARGECMLCKEPRLQDSTFCRVHLLNEREKMLVRTGSKPYSGIGRPPKDV